MQIGPIRIEPELCLAPMAGHTNLAFRKLCRSLGGVGLVCTELISSAALENRGMRERSLRYYDWCSSEFPFAVQLYGHDPWVMGEAARIVVDLGAPIVDINLGCWVPKVVKKGGGAALLSCPEKARGLVEAVVKAVSVPVTVKVRTGVKTSHPTAVEFARQAEDVGVAAVAVHGRSAEQGFTGDCDWGIIARVKEAVKIPVIGNGDVTSLEEARRMRAETGCDAVMIGRAALGRPWIFSGRAEPDRAERAAIALQHARLTLETTQIDPRSAVLELRGQLSRYRLDEPGSTRVRDALVRVTALAEVEAILEEAAQKKRPGLRPAAVEGSSVLRGEYFLRAGQAADLQHG